MFEEDEDSNRFKRRRGAPTTTITTATTKSGQPVAARIGKRAEPGTTVATHKCSHMLVLDKTCD